MTLASNKIKIICRYAGQVLFFAMPWSLRRRCLQLLLQYKLDPKSYIGYSLLDVRHCVMEAKSRIGNFNFIRNLDILELGEDAGIGNFNNITGYPGARKGSFGHLTNRVCRLVLSPMSGITSRHYVDCTAGVTVGKRTTIAGIRSTILTHSIDVYLNRQDAKPIYIGEGCFIGTNVILLPGVQIADYCVVAAGSVVNKSLTTGGVVYAGNPAGLKLELDINSTKYFRRDKGNVS